MKIKWGNIIKALLLIASSSIIIHDLFIMLIEPIITTFVRGWTWWGLATFILALTVCISTFDDLYEQIKSISEYEYKHARNTK